VGQEQPSVVQQADPSLANTVQGLQELVQTIVTGIDSRPIAEETIQRLGLQIAPGTLLQNLTVEQIGTTQFITLTYEDTDPERAQEIANTVSQVSSERIPQVSTSANGITTTIWEDATIPDTPVSPDPVRNGLLALALGLMFGIGLAFVTEYLDDSWRSPEEVEQVSGLPTFGVIPKFEIMKSERKERR
jgi:capsular polysaccharide biosynthesis protein